MSTLSVRTAQSRAPWWAWVLYSLASICLTSLVVVGGMLALLVSGINFTDYIYLRYPPFIDSGMAGAALALIIAGPKLTGLLVMRCFRPTRTLGWGVLRAPTSWPLLWRRVGLGVIYLAMVQAVWALLGWRAPESWNLVGHLVYAVRGHFWPALWLVLAVAIITPIGEEVVYRGLAFGMLRQRKSFWWAAVWSAVLFGVPHGFSVIPAALMGVYFAHQVEEDQSAWGAIILHAMNNTAGLLLMALG